MIAVTLPVLDDTVSAAEAWETVRRHRRRIVLTRSGDDFWLHEDEDIAAAMRHSPETRLNEVRRRRLTVLSAPGGDADIDALLRRHGPYTVVASTAPIDRLLHSFVDPTGPLAEVEATAYHCPDDPNEVSTKPIFCNIHQKNYVKDA